MVEKEISLSSSSDEYRPRKSEDKEPDSFERDENDKLITSQRINQ